MPAKKTTVAEFMNELKHPQKKEIEALRTIILASDKNLTEHIKWNAPSFCYQGDDRITFNLTGKRLHPACFSLRSESER